LRLFGDWVIWGFGESGICLFGYVFIWGFGYLLCQRECSENCVNQNLLNWLVRKTVFLSDEKVKS
jgi:hypothetical protein